MSRAHMSIAHDEDIFKIAFTVKKFCNSENQSFLEKIVFQWLIHDKIKWWEGWWVETEVKNIKFYMSKRLGTWKTFFLLIFWCFLLFSSQSWHEYFSSLNPSPFFLSDKFKRKKKKHFFCAFCFVEWFCFSSVSLYEWMRGRKKESTKKIHWTRRSTHVKQAHTLSSFLI